MMARLIGFFIVILIPSVVYSALIANAPDYLHSLGIQMAYSWDASHPSVIDFLEEHGLSEWPPGSGKRYYAAWTTAEACGDYYEPEVVYLQSTGDSAGQSNWTSRTLIDDYGTCAGPEPGEFSTGNNTADPAIIYDSWNDQLVMFVVREPEGTTTKNIMRSTLNTSLQQSSWSQVLTGTGTSGPITPTVVYEGEDHLHMWYLTWNGVWNNAVTYIKHRESFDNGVTWGAEESVDISALTNSHTNWYPWHFEIDVNPYYDDMLELVTSMRYFDAIIDDSYYTAHARLTLADPLTLTNPLGSAHIMDPATVNSWDDWLLYKPSVIPDRDGAEVKLRLWYNGAPDGLYDGVETTLYDVTGYAEGVIGLYIPWVDNDKAGGVYTAGTTITLSTPVNSTADAIKYRWDGGVWQTYSAPVTMQDGLFEWYGEDTGSGETMAVQSDSYLIDTAILTGVAGAGSVGTLVALAPGLLLSTDLNGNSITITDLNNNPLTSAPLGQ